jgi:hypothetical protein
MSKSKLVEDLYPLIDPATARIMKRPPLVLRWVKQRNSIWTTHQKVCFLDTVARGWSCAPLYFLSHEKDGVQSENLFDGAHKLESIYQYIRGDYEIVEIKDYSWKTSPLQQFVGKQFSELPLALQNKFLKYEFNINYVPEDVANDPEALRILWQRLNNAGTPLNGYELDIPVYGSLHNLLEEQSNDWTNTIIFTKQESQRGKLEEKLYQLLALSDETWQLPSFSSLPDLYVKWRATLGSTITEIEERIHSNKPDYTDRLKRLRKFLQELESRGTFRNGDVPFNMTPHQVPLLIILGRLGYWFSTFSQFNIHAEEISKKLKSEIFGKSANDVVKQMNCPSRNAKFQSKVIEYIDAFLEPLSKRERRFFTKEERKCKLAIQNNRCALCSQKLALNDSEADHVIPVCQGGKTTLDNCQVLHRHCHQNKGTTQN